MAIVPDRVIDTLSPSRSADAHHWEVDQDDNKTHSSVVVAKTELPVSVSVEHVKILLEVGLEFSVDRVNLSKPSVSLVVHFSGHLSKSSVQEVLHFSDDFLRSFF